MRVLAFLLCLVSLRLLAANGDIASVEVEPNGRSVLVKVLGVGTGGTYAFGLGASNRTLALATMRLTVVSTNGWDDAGAQADITRTFYGAKQMRKVYPDHATINETVDGSDVILQVAIGTDEGDGHIYTNDTVTATFRSGFYTQGGTPSNVTNALAAVNNSYFVTPRSLMFWADYPDQLVGSNVTLRVIAAQADAREGRPVRAVKCWARDTSGNYTTTNTVTRMTWNSARSNAAYEVTLNYGPLTQGETVSNHCEVIPWIGRKLNTEDGVNPPYDRDYCPFRLVCNKTGDFPGIYALVDPVGGTTAGVAVTNWDSFISLTNAPFATPRQALNACGATNNAKNGVNTYDNCQVYVTNDTSSLFWGAGTDTSRSASKTWTLISSLPGANRTNAILYNTASTDSQEFMNTLKLKFQNVNINNTNRNFAFCGQGYGEHWFSGCLVSSNLGGSSTRLVAFHTNIWVGNCDFIADRNGIILSTTPNKGYVYLENNTFHDFASGVGWVSQPNVALGNIFRPSTASQYAFKNDQLNVWTADPFCWIGNRFYRVDESTTYNWQVALATNLNVGCLIANNLLESTKRSANAIGFDVAQSAHTNEKFTNFLGWVNTALTTYHAPYGFGYDGVTTAGYQDVGNIFADLENAFDQRNTDSRGTNRWDIMWGGSRTGNAHFELGSNQFTSESENGFNGFNNYYDAGTNVAASLFTDNQGYGSAATNGLGTYTVRHYSPLQKLGPQRRVWPFDADGKARGAGDPPGAFVAIAPKKGGGFFAQ